MIPYEYIAIEGNIGAGKTSLVTRISEDFQSRLVLEEFEDNPFLPKFYESPERYAFPVELSFLAERFAQLKSTLMDRDLFKRQVVSDYFLGKSLIFAKANLEEDEYDLFMKMYSIMQTTLPQPNLLVYLYLSVEQLQQNISKRGRSYEQSIADDYLINIQDSYFQYLKQQQHVPILIVDTNELDFVNREEDYQYLVGLLSQQYTNGIHRIRPKNGDAH